MPRSPTRPRSPVRLRRRQSRSRSRSPNRGEIVDQLNRIVPGWTERRTMQRTTWVHRGRVFPLAGAAFEYARSFKKDRTAARMLLSLSRGRRSPKRRRSR